MDERKNYLNIDELQADDELSPLSSQEGQVSHQQRQSDEPRPKRPGAEQRVPPPAATSE